MSEVMNVGVMNVGQSLNALVDYIYKGEVSISVADLHNFCLLTKELGLEAIETQPESSGSKDPLQQPDENWLDIKNEPMDPDVASPAGPQLEETKMGRDEMRRVSRKEKSDTDSSSNNPDHSIEQARYLYSIKTRELDNDIKAMMELSQNFVHQSKGHEHKREKMRLCKACGKEGRLFAIKRHIEAIHISGISHPCDVCGKTCLSRDRLRRHKSVHHCK